MFTRRTARLLADAANNCLNTYARDMRLSRDDVMYIRQDETLSMFRMTLFTIRHRARLATACR